MAAKSGKKPKKNSYVRNENPALRKVVRGLRALVTAAVPGTKLTVNSLGIPTFESKTSFCLYMVGKNHVTFGFQYGTSLNDPEKLLEGMGKNIRHVKLRTDQGLQQRGLRKLVIDAARLKGKPPMNGMSG